MSAIVGCPDSSHLPGKRISETRITLPRVVLAVAAPTLCERLGMAFVPLKAIHIGSVYSYDGRMSQQGWMVATREERGNFFHALKW